jgi:hypothetical protein
MLLVEDEGDVLTLADYALDAVYEVIQFSDEEADQLSERLREAFRGLMDWRV